MRKAYAGFTVQKVQITMALTGMKLAARLGDKKLMQMYEERLDKHLKQWKKEAKRAFKNS